LVPLPSCERIKIGQENVPRSTRIDISRRRCFGAAFLSAVFLLSTPAPAKDKQIRISGLVVAVEENPRAIVVAHRPVPGWMPAMTMRFMAPREPRLEPGDQVEFVVKPGVAPLTARFLRRIPPDRSGIPQPPSRLSVGAEVPDFDLQSANGQRVRLTQLRGKVVALQFIYTRCPVADACPRLAATFAALRRRLTPAENRQVIFLSLSIDPEYDTPPVLREYAARWGVSPGEEQNWHFLTGPVEEIARFGQAFGLLFWPDEGAVGHTNVTGLVTPDGRVGAIVEGTSFRLDQWAGLLRRFLGGAK
jgi:protein SCO1